MFGLSIAFCCSLRGARVRVIDPAGVAAGASGGFVGALAPHTPDLWLPKKQFQLESLLYSRSFWPEVEANSNMMTGFSNHGRLQPINEERLVALALSRISDAEKNWGDKAVWEVVSANQVGDWAPPSATGQLIYDTLSAHIHPLKATYALARAVENLGGVITPAGARQGIIIDARGWQGLIEISKTLKQEIGNGVKGQAALLDFYSPGKPQLFSDGLHIVPHLDGTVGIGSTSERYFKSPTNTDEQLDDLIATAKKLFPVLKDAPVISRWAGVRPRAFTRAPMLGQHPVNQDWFIANGGFKIGFGMAPKIGQVMADLVLDGVDNIPNDFRASASLVSGREKIVK
mgnify:FL=1